MQPTTPTGSRTIRLLPTVVSYSKFSAIWAAMLNEFTGRPACTSVLSHLGMPASRVTSVPISSVRAPSPSAMRVQNLARSSGVVAAHEANAARAAVAAASTSAALPAGMLPITDPSVESNTSMVPWPCDGTQAPSM
jgi:hypothetical protein